MRMLKVLVATTALTISAPLLATADPDKDESGHGQHGEYWGPAYGYGECKVKREWKDDGEYKEEVKCDRDVDHGVYYSRPRVIVPAQRPSINIIVPID